MNNGDLNWITNDIWGIADDILRDTEQIPLQEEGGYEISFNRYFYKPEPMRTLAEIRADILAIKTETEGLLGEIIGDRGR